jgi:arylsulfatase A-like enzyme
LLKHLQDIGEADNTIVIFTTDNGAEVFTWPDDGMTPFRATKGTVFEGGFRVPCIARWPGKIKPGSVENGIFSGLDWLPTLAAAAGTSPSSSSKACSSASAPTRIIWTATTSLIS